MRRHPQSWHLDKAPQWRGEQNTHRTDQCRAWLYLHGYITHAENDAIRRRLMNDRGSADIVRKERPRVAHATPPDRRASAQVARGA